MKSVSTALSNHIGHLGVDADRTTTLTHCWLIRRTDGTEFRFTSLDRDVVISGWGAPDVFLNGTYEAETGQSRTALESTGSTSVDNLEIESFFDSSGISDTELLAGRFDLADIWTFLVNWQNLSQGPLRLSKGRFGEMRLLHGSYRIEQLGMKQSYAQQIAEVFTADCRAELGDARCKINLEPATWQQTTEYEARIDFDAATEQNTPGSVVAPTVPNDRHFLCTVAGTSGGTEPVWDTTLNDTLTPVDGGITWKTVRARNVTAALIDIGGGASADPTRQVFELNYTGDAPDAFFTGGLCRFTSGQNNGISMEIESWLLASKRVTLFLPIPFTVAAGDTVTLFAGCDKKLATCKDTYADTFNSRSEAYVPGEDRLRQSAINT